MGRWLCGAVLVTTVGFCAAVWGQELVEVPEDYLGVMMAEAQKGAREGRRADANAAFETALGLAEKCDQDDLVLARRLETLANCLGPKQMWRCEPFLRRAITIRERLNGPESLEVARDLFSLALDIGSRGHTVEGEELILRGIAIRQRSLGSTDPDVALGYIGWANIAMLSHNPAKAEGLAKAALTILESDPARNRNNLGMALNSLVLSNFMQGNYSEAEACASRWVTICTDANRPEDPSVAEGLGWLALVAEGRGDYEAERQLRERVVSLKRRAGFDEEDAGLRGSLFKLEFVYLRAGQEQKAKAIHEERKAVARKYHTTAPDVSALFKLSPRPSHEPDATTFDPELTSRLASQKSASVTGNLISKSVVDRYRADFSRQLLGEKTQSKNPFAEPNDPFAPRKSLLDP